MVIIINKMPKVVNHDARRVKIALAAAEAIAEVGVDRVKMTDLAAAAGCTVGALPHYFKGGKDEILIAALREVHTTIRTRATQVAIDTRFDPLAVWMSVLPSTPAQRKEWLVWIAFSGRGPFNEVLGEELKARHERGTEDTISILRSMQAVGELPNDLDLRDAAETITALVDGIGMRATLSPKDWPPEKMRAQLLQQLERMGYQRGTRHG